MRTDDTHDNEGSEKLPNQKELEKELSEYLSKKYGNRIKIISPFLFPREKELPKDEAKAGKEKGNLPSFDMLPEELEAYLDSFIVKQDQAKAVLATKICTHFNRAKYFKEHDQAKKSAGVGMIKNNVLMIGPTGVGKTYIVKLIAQKLGVPFVKGDATKFSETGYVGGDVEDLVRDLVYEAKDDISLAENGIIYIDEIDKIASSENFIGHDVSRTGVQRALLKPMEETEVDLKVPHDAVSQIQAIEHFRRTGKKEKRVVNTKNILFIVSGAFGNLAEIIKKRLQRQGIGFEADVKSKEVPWEILKEVTAQDLIEFGFESEFVGRLPVVVVFDELTEEDLVEILRNPNNPVILSKRRDFRAYGIDIRFEDEALRKIAAMAVKEKTGARGLVSAIEKVLIPFEKHLPSTNIKILVVTPELVENPEAELKALQESYDDPERIERFEAAVKQEVENVKKFISRKSNDFHQISGLEISDSRTELIAELYFKMNSDINTALDDFVEMYRKIKTEEESLLNELDLNLHFDDEAIDELIRKSIETGYDAGFLVSQLAKKLEYGLKLVKDRSGVDHFTIGKEAVTDMEQYINGLVKKFYRREYDPYVSEESQANKRADDFPGGWKEQG
ncbi:MAG: AAA family ATPase [Deltaproteobacteria bacterium]|nr:AAA family ATPase [Deltaproteobacteria bacterium]MBW1920371.1 AAA family ATPase [Deltaproteobacteria bacterium]MBW1932268.1 AAA family ATPase [Deltaproteobacteria bacterium]MBW1978119.1 AAA family ATPase [Deltaproteobacteria bacterium]MBW2044809.1 AAA family ATPase [Deltaproteobacteria bacterium]